MRLLPVIAAFTFFFSLSAFSQVTDSLPVQPADSLPKQLPKAVSYNYSMDNDRVDYPIDTGLAQFHYYDPVDKMNFQYRNTGAFGSASFRIVCCEKQPMGFRLGYDQFNLYRFGKYNAPFYSHTRPYSQLNILIGLKKEQTINVTHSQNIGKKFNFGFHYMRFATSGTFVNQRTRHNDLAFTTTFENKKRYQLKTLLVFNNIRSAENGGVQQTTIYKDTSFISKELVDVELESAENKQRDISFHIRQSLRNKMAAIDTVSDSTAVQPAAPPPLLWEVYHEIDVGREQYEYLDPQPDSAYYGLFFPTDSNVTALSSKAKKVFAGTRLGFKKFFFNHLILDASASYTINLVEQDRFAEVAVHYSDASVAVMTDTAWQVLFGADATFSFIDYNKGDFKTNAYAGYEFKRAGKILLSASYSRIEPALISSRFAFGRVQWVADWDKQSLLTASLGYQLPKYHLRAAVHFNHINNFAFWDQNRLPAQYNGYLQAWVFEFRKLFRIRHFGFDNVIYVQLVSDKDFLRYPVYWGVHSLFYERGVFKGRLLTRVGIDIRYNTNYAAPGYFPLTGQFHLQLEEQLTFYPTLDFYLCFKIKTARIFFKLQHLNQGMFKDKGIFHAYKYPGGDRTFRFGLSWMFLE